MKHTNCRYNLINLNGNKRYGLSTIFRMSYCWYEDRTESKRWKELNQLNGWILSSIFSSSLIDSWTIVQSPLGILWGCVCSRQSIVRTAKCSPRPTPSCQEETTQNIPSHHNHPPCMIKITKNALSWLPTGRFLAFDVVMSAAFCEKLIARQSCN